MTDPDKSGFWRKGMHAWRSSRPAEALVWAERYLDSLPKGHASVGPARILLAEAMTQLGRHKEAETLLTTVLDENTTEGPCAALTAMGALDEQRGRFVDAAAWYRRYIDNRSSDHRGYMMLGSVLKRLGQLSEAETQLLRARSLNDSDETVHLELGCVYLALGKLLQAGNAFSRALHIDPDFHRAQAALEDVTAAVEAEALELEKWVRQSEKKDRDD